jgi:hypothetical protein
MAANTGDTIASNWNGIEFQQYCMMLLQRRYSIHHPHTLQMVPDKNLGDLGMEAFSHTGNAYQCYAAEEPLSVQARLDKQQAKLTRDLGKLQNKSGEVGAMLGTIVLEKYVFIVPTHDSRQLIAHAHKKAADVIAWALPFISSDFAIIVETLDDYVVEQSQIHALPEPIVDIGPVDVAFSAAWAGENTSLVERVDRKLGVIVKSSKQRDLLTQALVDQYLSAGNALEHLKSTSPDAYQAVLRTKAAKENLLVLEYPTSSESSRADLAAVAGDLANELKSANPMLSDSIANHFAWSAVADWLMRCPLDFGGEE